MLMPGMLVRSHKRREIMIVSGKISSRVYCCWYENGKRKWQFFSAEELIVIEAGYSHLSFT
jgi:uncharacterized protein YodC (DUF2158 family)